MFNKLKTPRSKRTMRIMLKSSLITVVIFYALVGTAMFAWSRIVVPPEPPALRPVIRHIDRPADPDLGDEYDPDYDDRDTEYVWPAPERVTDDDRRDMFFTFLIIGLNEGTNANTIMVASFDYATGNANLVSIPRDVPVHPTRNGRKLSSSYLIGARGGRGLEGGVNQVQMDVMGVIGFIPDFYIVIDYDAFFAIIDAVGGIDIYVPFRFYNCDPYQDLFIDIPAGWHNMDSHMALHFARFREANEGHRAISDFQRIQNQQEIVRAVARNLLRPANLLRIPEFINIFNDSVDTDLSIGNLTWFATRLHGSRGLDALSTYTMPVSHTGTVNRVSYVFLDADGVLELVNRTINPFYVEIEMRDVNIIGN